MCLTVTCFVVSMSSLFSPIRASVGQRQKLVGLRLHSCCHQLMTAWSKARRMCRLLVPADHSKPTKVNDILFLYYSKFKIKDQLTIDEAG